MLPRPILKPEVVATSLSNPECVSPCTGSTTQTASRPIYEFAEKIPSGYLLYHRRATAFFSLNRHPNAPDFKIVLALTSSTFNNAFLIKAKIHTKDGCWADARHALTAHQKNRHRSGRCRSIAEAEAAAEKAQLWTACTDFASSALKLARHSLEIGQLQAECALPANFTVYDFASGPPSSPLGSSDQILVSGWFSSIMRVARSPYPSTHSPMSLQDKWPDDSIYAVSCGGRGASHIRAGSARNGITRLWDVPAPVDGWAVYAPGNDRSPAYDLVLESSRLFGAMDSHAFVFGCHAGDVRPQFRMWTSGLFRRVAIVLPNIATLIVWLSEV